MLGEGAVRNVNRLTMTEFLAPLLSLLLPLMGSRCHLPPRSSFSDLLSLRLLLLIREPCCQNAA